MVRLVQRHPFTVAWSVIVLAFATAAEWASQSM